MNIKALLLFTLISTGLSAENSSNIDIADPLVLHKAVQKLDLEAVRELIMNGANLSYTDCYDKTALDIAREIMIRTGKSEEADEALEAFINNTFNKEMMENTSTIVIIYLYILAKS